MDIKELKNIVDTLRCRGDWIIANRIEAAITPKPALTLPLTVGQRVMFGSVAGRIVMTDYRGKGPVVIVYASGAGDYITFADQNGQVINNQGQLTDAPTADQEPEPEPEPVYVWVKENVDGVVGIAYSKEELDATPSLKKSRRVRYRRDPEPPTVSDPTE